MQTVCKNQLLSFFTAKAISTLFIAKLPLPASFLSGDENSFPACLALSTFLANIEL